MTTMPCLVALLALLFPRVVLVLVFLLTDYIQKAFPDSLLWPLLGFIFLPLTTLVYAWAINVAGAITGVYLVVMILAVLFDLGLLGGSAKSRRN